MNTMIMVCFYGFLAGLLVLVMGFGVKKQSAPQIAQMLSAAGGTISACCFFMILCMGYLSTLL